jgi:DDE superfamily endonuclease
MAQGYLLGRGQPQAKAWIQRLRPVLKTGLGYDVQLPARSRQDIKAVLATCPGLEFLIDGPERPVRRPKDKARQKANYSGQKKRHTRQNNVITDKATGKIKGLSPTVEGNRPAKKLADEQPWAFPKGTQLWKDTGFQGYEPKNAEPFQPTNKPKGRDLSPEEKSRKSTISQERISIEHTLGSVKVLRIVHDVFRTVRLGFDDLVMDIACGLHNRHYSA